MLEIVLYLSGAALAMLVAPAALRMRIDRPLPGGAIAMRADAALLAGLVGVAVTGPGAWRWSPTLGRRSLGGISFPLRARGEPGRRELRGQPMRRPETAAGTGRDRPPPPKRTASKRLVRFPMEPGLRLLGSLARAINLRRVRVDGHFGLGDPAKTGYIYGVLQAVEASLPKRRKQLEIRLEPDFREQVLCGRLDICLHFSLTRVAASLLRFGLEVGIKRVSDNLESVRWIPFPQGWKAS